jgi:CBS domain-containing protein
MRVSSVCSKNVAVIEPGASAREAAGRMSETHAGTLVVVGPDGGRPSGILTDRDLVLKVMAKGASPEAECVANVMTREVATCRHDDDLFEAARLMRWHGVRRLPVLDAKGMVIGLVTADDIYAALAAHVAELGQAFARERLHELEGAAP